MKELDGEWSVSEEAIVSERTDELELTRGLVGDVKG